MPNRQIHEVLANRPFVCVAGDAAILDVVRQMKLRHCSAALVEAGGSLCGLFTERDATFRVLAEGLDAATTPVSAVMTTELITLGPDKPFGHALHLMFENQVRHVPIVDDAGSPLGIVTARDALQLEAVTFGAELERREEITAIL